MEFRRLKIALPCFSHPRRHLTHAFSASGSRARGFETNQCYYNETVSHGK